jgi:probable rRNA maturation factor
MARRASRSPSSRAPVALVNVQKATGVGRLPSGVDWVGWTCAAGAAAKGEIALRLVGLAESRRLNERFRDKKGATNVLAFPAGVSGELGDLVICLPLVYREAHAQDKKTLHHLAHLFVHGILHLRGYGHDRPAEARRMEQLERRILGRLGFPDPYQEQT